MSGPMDVTASNEGEPGSEQPKRSSGDVTTAEMTSVIASEATPKKELAVPTAGPQCAETAPQSEVTPAPSSTPTPIKRKRLPSSTDIDTAKTNSSPGAGAVVTPAKGYDTRARIGSSFSLIVALVCRQVITTYSEWLSQSKGGAKSASKSASKAAKSAVKATNGAKAKTTSGKKGRPKAEKSAGSKTPGKKVTKKMGRPSAGVDTCPYTIFSLHLYP